MRRKIVFLLIDGVGDVALPQLLDMTPLQVASTPFMDRIAGATATLMYPFRSGTSVMGLAWLQLAVLMD